MKKFRVGIILSTSIEIEAESEDEAVEIALDDIADEYPEFNVEESNSVEEVGEDNETDN